MKNFNKIKTSLFILLAGVILIPSISLADPTGTCTYSATGNVQSGYTQAQCPSSVGTWLPDQTGADDGPLGTCTLITGSTASGYTQTGCTTAGGTKWVQDANQGSNPPPNNSNTGSNKSNTSNPNSSPTTSTAAPNGGLVPACSPNCGFNDFMTLINTVVHFILFAMAVPISAIMFAYAGFLLVTSAGSTEQRGKAKRIFTNVAIGLILAVAAWLIIELILKIVGFDGSWIGFK